MFDQWLRQWKDRWLFPVAMWIGPRVSPNAVSGLAFVVGLACAAAAYAQQPRLAFALWLGNRVLDGLDGSVARAHATQSDFGGYLDIMLDFVVYAAIPLAIASGDPTTGLLTATMWLLAAFFVNSASWMYLAAILERHAAGAAQRAELTTITMPPGLIAGTETVVLYAVFLLWPAARLNGFTLMAALVGMNIIQRLLWARRELPLLSHD